MLKRRPQQQTLPFRTSDWNDIGKPSGMKASTATPGQSVWNPNLQGFQFHTEQSVRGEEGERFHRVSAIGPEGGVHGTLDWHPSHGEISMIEVHKSAQGKGLAQAMWHRAHALSQGTRYQPPMQGQQRLFDYTPGRRVVPPRHSAYRTEEGNKFAHSVGGHIPEWKRVHLYGGATD